MKLFHELFKFYAHPCFPLSVDGSSSGGGASHNDGSASSGQSGDGGSAKSSAGDVGGNAGDVGAGQGASGGTGQAAHAGPILGADGKFLPGWAKQLGGTDALEAKFTDPKALVGSYTALEKLISAKGIIPPGPNATAENKSAFYKALGRPDKPEDYGIKMPEKIGDKPFPKELWDDKQAQGFAKWAHEHGWTTQQVKDAIEFDAARTLSAVDGHNQQQAAAKTAAETVLKAEFGNDYGAKLKLAEAGAKAAGFDGTTPENAALANSPGFIRAMAKVGAMLGEGRAAGARTTGASGLNPAAEIAAIFADKNHPFQPQNAKANPLAHKEAVAHVARLFRLKNGEAA